MYSIHALKATFTAMIDAGFIQHKVFLHKSVA